MSARRKLGEGSDKVDINISPMIDCVFILLIFFIVTTVFVEEEGLDVNKPQPSAVSSMDEELIKFRITKKGQVLFNGQDVGLNGVRVTVRNGMQRKMVPVILEVEHEAAAGLMVRVMDHAKAAGAEQISINAAGN